jgi:wobble nucleotide-excising tRNase
MAEMKVDLSEFTDRYATGSQELKIAKNTTFIFGKNGTGKTTIADAIRDQFSEKYKVCVFKDFDGVVENERLNAIALGTENAEIQKQIEVIDKEIIEIEKETVRPEGNAENLFTKLETADKNLGKQDNKIKKFYTDSARSITISRGLGRTYNTNNFQDDIKENPNLLSDDEIKKHKATIKAEPKATVIKSNFPELDLAEWLKSTNEVLVAQVAPQQIIAELQNNSAKQDFAKTGVDLHAHDDGTHDKNCAFCGNEISNERWTLLGSYFNDEVKKLEGRIKNGIAKLDAELSEIENIKDVGKSDFYDRFTEQIKMINLQIKDVKSDHKTFFTSLKSALENKKKNLFSASDELKLVISPDFSAIKTEYEKMVDENNDFSKNLKTEQDKAKTALRFHEVKRALDAFKYEAESQKLIDLKSTQEQAKKVLNDRRLELEGKKTAKIELILQTKDESKIAKEINELLKNMGVASFSLELVKDHDESQKGQYQIKGHNGKIRTITELSKGEKNIIAFLYFILALSNPNTDNRPKIVVLDDPMTSNDDTIQYLIISEIQKYYRKIAGSNFFILLTHNCHFYLNVRPNTTTTYKKAGEEISLYEKYGIYHIFSDGKLSTVREILKGKEDFRTNYETLWQELLFLYEAKDAISDLMLNPCRRICDTYMDFTKKDPAVFYGENINAKKLFDVNLHSIADHEAEQNGKTKTEIKEILRNLFVQNGAEDHFNNYWKEKT